MYFFMPYDRVDMFIDSREESLKEASKITVKENSRIMANLIRDWNLGPNKAFDNNTGNTPFWANLAKIWFITIKEARRRSCANCEYGRISPDFLKAMEHVPYNRFDKDGGMRVWCDKFDFICHATRVCQAWEKD